MASEERVMQYRTGRKGNAAAPESSESSSFPLAHPTYARHARINPAWAKENVCPLCGSALVRREHASPFCAAWRCTCLLCLFAARQTPREHVHVSQPSPQEVP